MTQALIPLAEPDRWRAALRGVPHAFAHTWGSCHAMQLTSGLATFLYAYDDGRARVVCPLSVRTCLGEPDILTPYGFSGFTGTGPCPDLPARWAEFARAQGWICGYLALNPALDSAPYHDPADRHALGTLYVLDLTGDEPAIFGRLSANRQRQVRAWERSDVALVDDRPRLAAFFAEHLAAFLDERRASRAYYLTSATIEALFALDDVMILGAERDGRVEAVSVFAHTPYVGDFLFNVSTPAGRAHSAPLIWRGALRLRAAGVPALNLGGGIRPGDGVAEFKARFGGATVVAGALKQVYAWPTFAALCARVLADPYDRAGYFPPYHSR